MKNITKDESKQLQRMGLKFGETIHKTHTKHPHYYLVEDAKALEMLERIRNHKK